MNSSPRQKFISKIKKVVIKVGSSILTDSEGNLSPSAFRKIALQVSEIRNRGIKVVIVSSGAIAAGMKKLGLSKRPVDIHVKQAIAASGQTTLMQNYENAFRKYGINVAQILLTHDGLSNRKRFLNARKTIYQLFSMDILPVVNENDTVAVEEIMFGDNDNLAAFVTSLTEADLLVLLTDIDGLYDKDPRKDPDARFIPQIDKIDQEIEKIARSTTGRTTVGGMATKIQATRTAAAFGVPTIIANGSRKDVLLDIFEGGETGTLINPEKEKMSARKHWIAYTLKTRGEIVIDDGAKDAVTRYGKSVLPTGVIGVKGKFDIGDAIVCLDKEGNILAKGLTSYSSREINKILGAKTSEIESILGYTYGGEILHRDDLAVMADIKKTS